MTEYIIILGVIAIMAIGVFGFFRDTVRQQMTGMNAELSGTAAGGAAAIAASQANAASSTAASAAHGNLGNYNLNSQAGAGGN